jgi:hypothetical protein
MANHEKHETTVGIVLLVMGILATIGGLISLIEVEMVNSAIPGFSISPLFPGAILIVGLVLITIAVVDRK